MTDTESEFLEHIPCDNCGSSDANALYDDGHTHCFSCGHHTPPDGEERQGGRRVSKEFDPIPGEFAGLQKRKIKEVTCRKFGYRVGHLSDGTGVHLAPYYNKDGVLVGQKVRPGNKEMWVNGKVSGLFGQQLWKEGGRKVVITEGEIDAMAVSQVQQNKWPVVSVPTGAKGAAKAISKEIEWLCTFSEVVLMFDMDDPGQTAVAECVQLFPPGKAKVAKLPFKDAGECLEKGQGEAIVQAIWQAQTWRPDGLVTVADLIEEAKRPVEMGIAWPWPTLTRATYGRRRGELYMLGAGTGVGKTDVFTQIIAQTVTELELPVGVFYLEQPPVETLRRIAGKLKGRRFHVPDAGWTAEERDEAFSQLAEHDRIHFYNHFGSTDWDIIESTIRYLALNEGVKDFFIDHLTAMADPANERESLEELMKAAASLAQELGITLYMVSHLATPDGKPHEEGGRVMIRHFKGARAIGFWSHFMFGLERDQQAEDEDEASTTTFRILKDRYTGQGTGTTFYLNYDHETGMLSEAARPDDEPDFTAKPGHGGQPDDDEVHF